MNQPSAAPSPPSPPSPPSSPAPRRRALYALLAGAAGAAGVGAAWWKFQAGAAAGAAAGDGAAGIEQALWQQSFEMPDGAPLVMQSFHGQPLLVNFWATWCPPCIAELPLLDAFFQENSAKGWQVVGLAVDKATAVRSFLARTPVRFPVGIAQQGGSDLARRLGNLSGGLPFTVVLGRDGRVLHRKIGQIKAPDLERWRDLPGVK